MKNEFLKKLYNIFCLSKDEKYLYKYFLVDKSTKQIKKDILLLQCVEDYFYYGLFGTIIKDLKKKQDILVHQYVVRNLTVGSTLNFKNLLKSFLLGNRIRDNKWVNLYSSYCDSVAYRHEGTTNIFVDLKALFTAYKIFKKLKTKEQVLSLIIENIKVGDLVYDSYLRFKPAATVDVNDYYLFIVIWQCIRNISITQQYFKTYRPKYLFTSYGTYIQHGIAVRIALEFGTKVFSFGNNQNFAKQLSKDDWFHAQNVTFYKESFEGLSYKEELCLKSKKDLNQRFQGVLDTTTSFMKESAYKVFSDIQVPDIRNHIIIFLHDFYDSPHIYNHMVFPDFLEWIEYTIELLEQNNIPYCLKPHPNQIADSEEVIKELKLKYPNAKFISTKITNKQLVDAGISAGISVYGTVAHELTYLGVPVILCGDNPHSSYNFCFEAHNVDEYKEFILNYNNLILIDEYKKEVESFYYMHNLASSEEMKQLMSTIVILRKYNVLDDKFFDLLDVLSKNVEFKKFIKYMEIIK